MAPTLTPTVPQVIDITGRKSPAEIAAEREWVEASRRRIELRKQLQRARCGRHQPASHSNFNRDAWRRFGHETRTA